MLGQLSQQTYHDFFLSALATAGTDAEIVESSVIDCAGYDRVRAQLMIGATATQNGTVKFYVEECATSDGSYTALSGATIGTHTHGASGETAKIYEIDAKLNYRYIKIVYQRETQNTALLCGTYELYNNKKVPITQATNIKEQVVV